jgi:hypothetical protein
MTDEEIQEAKRNSLTDAIHGSLGLMGIILAFYFIFHFILQTK